MIPRYLIYVCKSPKEIMDKYLLNSVFKIAASEMCPNNLFIIRRILSMSSPTVTSDGDGMVDTPQVK